MGSCEDQRQWHPAHHDSPRQWADNLWTVDAALPHMDLRRRMTVVRLTDNTLLLYSVICLDEAGMAWLEQLGPPSIMIIPNGHHRMDAARYKARYPALHVWGPAGNVDRAREVTHIDRLLDTIAVDIGECVTVRTVQGTYNREIMLFVHSAKDTSMVVCDSIFNIGKHDGHGFFWWFYMHLLGNAGHPRITTLTRLFLIAHRRDFIRGLHEAALTPGLARIIMAHGEVIEHNASGVLDQLADSL